MRVFALSVLLLVCLGPGVVLAQADPAADATLADIDGELASIKTSSSAIANTLGTNAAGTGLTDLNRIGGDLWNNVAPDYVNSMGDFITPGGPSGSSNGTLDFRTINSGSDNTWNLPSPSSFTGDLQVGCSFPVTLGSVTRYISLSSFGTPDSSVASYFSSLTDQLDSLRTTMRGVMAACITAAFVVRVVRDLSK
jgi:hypothetical protein